MSRGKGGAIKTRLTDDRGGKETEMRLRQSRRHEKGFFRPKIRCYAPCNFDALIKVGTHAHTRSQIASHDFQTIKNKFRMQTSSCISDQSQGYPRAPAPSDCTNAKNDLVLQRYAKDSRQKHHVVSISTQRPLSRCKESNLNFPFSCSARSWSPMEKYICTVAFA